MRRVKIQHAILPGRDPSSRWDIQYERNTITSIKPAVSGNPTEPSPLLLPPLCHPHIHLDKAYLLTCNSKDNPANPSARDSTKHPDYIDLAPQDGSFGEALKFTSLAKKRYTPEDLYLRGAQFLAASLSQGVTSCRAFVEIDHVTNHLCLQVALKLYRDCFEGKMKIQICAFAQDPIFSGEHAEDNRKILQHALNSYGEHIEAIGTTPYVEASLETSLQNIEWAVETALDKSLHLDFHLDYNLDQEQKPMVLEVLRILEEKKWKERADPSKTIVLGHCTRLTLLSVEGMNAIVHAIKKSQLPIHFVGLPTSDLFMMGRPEAKGTVADGDRYSANRPRGTLQVLDMIKDLNLNCCISVNNVGNAFTPWGTGDPLALASLGVGLYQAGTEEDANLLFECVSSRARKAIGLHSSSVSRDANARSASSDGHPEGAAKDTRVLKECRKGDILLVKNKEYVACPGHLGVKIPARQYISVKDVVWDPPPVHLRQILRSE